LRRAAVWLIAVSLISPVHAAPQGTYSASPEAMLGWINQYRLKPEPHRIPDAIRTAGRVGAFKDPENAGVFVGFLAGAIKANPARAEAMIGKILPLPPEQQWVVVRAIAYSGHPEWKGLLDTYKMHMPGRVVMADKYLSGELPTLEQLAMKKEKPSFFDKFRKKKAPKQALLEPSPDIIDTFWGYYFATSSYDPVARIIAMLPWSKEEDDVELLTLGGMAKYTLATNAAKDAQLLEMLKFTAKHRTKEEGSVLKEVIDAAETVETTKLRKDALAAIEELKRKGPGTKRKIAGWGQVGQGALALGCIGAAAAGMVALGLPCVIGGAVGSAALSAWTAPD
jgi:hypothetical protein